MAEEIKKPWQPGGPSPNPQGRPKLESTFGDVARRLLASSKIDLKYRVMNKKNEWEDRSFQMEAPEGETIYAGLVSGLMHEASQGNTKALKLLLERADGAVRQDINLEGSGGLSLEIVRKIMSKDTLAKDKLKVSDESTNEALPDSPKTDEAKE
jgi:hypothetical protein